MWYYFVHYNGWNKKYDTWIEDAGLIKMPMVPDVVAVVRGETARPTSGIRGI